MDYYSDIICDCGAEMIVADYELTNKIISGDGYFTPYEYMPEWVKYRCPECGTTKTI